MQTLWVLEMLFEKYDCHYFEIWKTGYWKYFLIEKIILQH